MTIKNEPTLKDALGGLINATRYCEQNDMKEKARELAYAYQMVAIESPNSNWNNTEE